MNLGMPEIMIILVIALIVFGPRKLPELGKSLGKAMNQFRRASEDFKRTWEQEVEIEKTRQPQTAVTASGTEANSYHSPYSDDSYHYPSETTADTTATSHESHAPAAEPAVATAAPATQPHAESKPRADRWI